MLATFITVWIGGTIAFFPYILSCQTGGPTQFSSTERKIYFTMGVLLANLLFWWTPALAYILDFVHFKVLRLSPNQIHKLA